MFKSKNKKLGSPASGIKEPTSNSRWGLPKIEVRWIPLDEDGKEIKMHTYHVALCFPGNQTRIEQIMAASRPEALDTACSRYPWALTIRVLKKV